jgi:outer membrane receptor protein involved in Fe transport
MVTLTGPRQALASLCAVALTFPAIAGAASATPGDSSEDSTASSQTALAEIVVTAEKRTERIQDVPMSVSVISGNQLIATQSTTIQDIANAIPGLQVVSSSPTSNELVVRGITSGSGINSSVATYVDEVPYTSVGPFAYSANLAPNFDPYDISRVEVLRGPQGTLYGASALAGLLKYVTNAPDPSKFAASYLVGGNYVANGGAGYEAHGMVNLPLGATTALRIVIGDTYYPGYIDDPSRNRDGINEIRRQNARVAFFWQPLDTLTIKLTGAYQKLSAGDVNAVDLDASTLRPVYGDLAQERPFPQPSRVSNYIYNGTINWDVGFASLVSSTSWTKVDPFIYSDLSSIYGPILDSIFGGNLGAMVLTREPVHSVVQELRLVSEKQGPFEWTVGGFYTNETAHEIQALIAGDLDTHQLLPNFQPALGTYFIDSTYKEYAAFADVSYHITSAFELGAGGRYSKEKQTYHQVNDGAFTGSNNFITDSDQSVTTYSGDAKYRFNPEFMAYTRVASGFVPGGPNDVLPGSTLPPSFQSSKTTNYELGIKGSAQEGRINYDIDVFDVDWKNIQLIAQVGNLYGITNGGTARSRGMEASFTYKPITELTVLINGAYTNARLTQDTPTSFGGHDGDRLPLSPLFAGTIGLEYERPMGAAISGFGGFNWHWNGDRYADFNSGGPRAILPSYSTVDLRAGLKLQAYTFTAYIKNAGNSRGLTNVATETLGTEAALSANIIMPRTIGVNISASF